ncbi:MAG: hypothetical protein H0W50_04390 [Parachlamydiaceae bacterium]|nr:hypothetical protein [Parachlamydiaceae bacterium]
MSRWSDNKSGITLYIEPNEPLSWSLQLNELVKKINSLSRGEGCLIPRLILGHATLMRIENTGEEKVRILFYNTGDGVNDYHVEGKIIPIKPLSNTQKFLLEICRTLKILTALLHKK